MTTRQGQRGRTPAKRVKDPGGKRLKRKVKRKQSALKKKGIETQVQTLGIDRRPFAAHVSIKQKRGPGLGVTLRKTKKKK